MRPHKLTISGFLSYGTEVEIDFDKLSEAGGLFLIHGKTGAGKTSVLDAMSFAIYGELPGARKSLLKSLRSDFAQEATKTFVTFEATFGETRLRIHRTPAMEIAKQNGTGTTNKNATVTLERMVGGSWETMSTGAQEANPEIEKYVGLKADQFFKLILLPQGDFAQFLRSSSLERQKILQALFASEVNLFLKVAARFKDLHIQAKNDEDAARTTTSNELIAIHTSIDNVFGEENDDIELPGGSDAASEFVTDLENDIKAAQDAEQAATTAKDAAIAFETEVSKAFENSSKVRDAKANLTKATKELASWRLKQEKYIVESTKDNKVVAYLNDQILKLEKELAANARIKEKVDKLKNQRAATIALQKDLTKASISNDTLAKAIADRAKEISEFEAAAKGGADSEVLISQLDAQIQTATIIFKAAKDRDNARATIKTIEAELVDLKLEVVKTEADYESAELSADSAQASMLSAKLVAGSACPVCGSHEHPSPAPHADVLSKAEIKKFKDLAAAAKTALSKKEVDLAAPQALLKLSLENLDKKADSKSADIEGELAQLKVKLTEITKKLSDLKNAQTQIEKLNEAQNADKEKLPTLAAEVVRLTTQAASAVKTEKEIEVDLGIKAGETLDVVDSTKVNSTIEIHRKLIDEFEPILANVTSANTAIKTLTTDPDAEVPDINAAKAARIEAEAELTQASQDLKALAELKKSLAPKIKQLAKAETALTKATEQTERMGKLSEHLNGTAGQRIPLASYYLGHRLDQILVYANHRLIEMSRGQFALRSNPNKKGAGQNFLSISVFDSWNEGLRDASLLSGGETFAASLALAFGLADVVTNEAGGKSLESLFIDEGFGSLDPEYLNKVMESLEKLRESGRTIGLISHVEEMKASIPMQLEITKDSVNGASARITELESF